MLCTHVLNRGGRGVESPADRLLAGCASGNNPRAWRVITASRYMADEVRNFFQVPANKIDIIANGADTAPYDALD